MAINLCLLRDIVHQHKVMMTITKKWLEFYQLDAWQEDGWKA